MHIRTVLSIAAVAALGLGAAAVLASEGDSPKGKAAAPAPAPATAAAKASSTEAKDVKWSPLDPSNAKGPQFAVVHGDMKGTGPLQVLLKIPAGFKSGIHTHTNDYYGVVVSGAPAHGDDEKSAKVHAPGSTWYEPGKHPHFDTCTGKEDCVVSVSYPAGPFDFIPAETAKKK